MAVEMIAGSVQSFSWNSAPNTIRESEKREMSDASSCLFRLAPIDSQNPTISWHWVRKDSCARVRHVSCRLLRHCLCWFTEDRDGQAPVRPKCRSPHRQSNEEVRPWPDTFTSHRVELAGRSWAGPVQARSDCLSVHAAQGSTISGRLLHAVLRHRQS